MKFNISITCLIFINIFLSCSYRSYNLVETGKYGTILYAPKTTSLFKEFKEGDKGSKLESELRDKNRFQYIYIENLIKDSSNYISVVNSLDEAKYFFSRNNFKDLSNNKYYKMVSGNESIPLGNYLNIKYSNNSKFLLQINYGDLFKSNYSTKGIDSIFFDIAKKLLIEFSKREGKIEPNEQERFGWPATISQNIVEKIFELIPIPQEKSLARYLFHQSPNKSFVLLNTNIKLMVDAVQLIDNDDGIWMFNYIGNSKIPLYRDTSGKFIQIPFLDLKGKLPNNNVDENGKFILKASSADIQLSHSLNESSNYIFLYQNGLKESNENQGGDTNCKNTQRNQLECNSVLKYYNTPSFKIENDEIELGNADYTSSFGFRNLINPMITVAINGNYVDVPLNLRLSSLLLNFNNPKKVNIFRIHNGKYRKVKLNEYSIILLPNDKILF